MKKVMMRILKNESKPLSVVLLILEVLFALAIALAVVFIISLL